VLYQVFAKGLGDDDGYYEIYPDGADGDLVTVYCNLALGADYYTCDGCNEFWRFDGSSGWSSESSFSYSFDWHPKMGYCDGSDWEDKNADSLQECWEKCMPGGFARRFTTKCVNWNPHGDECYCTGDWVDDDDDGYDYDNDYEDDDDDSYCVRSDDNSWGVAVPRGTEFPGHCDYDENGYDHECPAGMEPINPRSRDHWVGSVQM
jgi:hypothetical protein